MNIRTRGVQAVFRIREGQTKRKDENDDNSSLFGRIRSEPWRPQGIKVIGDASKSKPAKKLPYFIMISRHQK
jgi:hypothetical protein